MLVIWNAEFSESIMWQVLGRRILVHEFLGQVTGWQEPGMHGEKHSHEKRLLQSAFIVCEEDRKPDSDLHMN